MLNLALKLLICCSPFLEVSSSKWLGSLPNIGCTLNNMSSGRRYLAILYNEWYPSSIPSQTAAYWQISKLCWISSHYGLSRWLSGKEPTFQCKRCVFNSWVGKVSGEGNGNPLQYFCLGNPTDRGARKAKVHGVTKSQTQLSNCACTSPYTLTGFR